MRSWHRIGRPVLVTMPPAWTFLCFVILVVLFDAPRFVAARLADVDVLQSMTGNNLEIGSAMLILFAAGLYGYWRVTGFSPLFRPDYCKWLESTPWTSRDPLPLGPVQLVWQDAFIPGALALLCAVHPALSGWFAALVVLVFIGAYLAMATFQILLTQQWLYGYLILFAAGLLLLAFAWDSAWCFSLVLVAICVMARLGMAASLAAFPWGGSAEWLQNQLVNSRRQATDRNGWPHDALQPDPQPANVPHPHGLLLGLLGGWWVFAVAVAAASRGEPVENATWVPTFVAAAVVLIRTGIYKLHYAAPISLWGRIRTGRWIIPEHDRVFLAQATAILVATCGTVLMQTMEPLVWLPIAVAITIACGFAIGPTRKEWLLLGHHRLRVALMDPHRAQWYRPGEIRRL